MSLNGSAQSIGSPSRMRGKEGDELGLGQTIRITPACAGKRAGPNNSLTGNQDHPRVCGEKAITVSSAHIMRGSPPRVRGKDLGLDVPGQTVGITPACAGKRKRPKRWVRPPKDHPRVCGEKSASQMRSRSSRGSPPRMRGKDDAIVLLGVVVGITPACAGKKGRKEIAPMSNRDHPRVCGEKLFQSPLLRLPLGSSPRMRGKDVRQELQHSGRGITPACAGKSPQRAHCSPVPWDHPRVCGEKCPPGKFFFMTVGSPPRVRGKVPSSI